MASSDDDRAWADLLGSLVEGVEVELPGEPHPATARLLDYLGVKWTVAAVRERRDWIGGDDMTKAEWFAADADGMNALDEKRSDAIDALRGAPSFSLTVYTGDGETEHLAAAQEYAPLDASAFLAYAALRAIQDFAAASGKSVEDCLEAIRIANQRGI